MHEHTMNRAEASPIENGAPTQALLDELVRRIVATVHPRRIVLFGSAARGQMGPHSDLDVLIVMPDGIHRRETAQKLYRELPGLSVGKDIVVVTERDVAEHADDWSVVLYPALREGRELYRDAAAQLGEIHMGQGHPPPGTAGQWIARARADLTLASIPLPEGALYEDLCLHAQQAAEKAIKAVFIHKNWRFQYTHSIADLLADLEGRGLTLPNSVHAAKALTQYVENKRYPEPAPGHSVNVAEYRRAIELAAEVLGWAESMVAA
jgi:HEPN domain-containing protein/predicted nucleotidyltransferase